MTDLSEAEFARMLAARGLVLDAAALTAALQGARHLRAEVARVARYMAEQGKP